MALYVLTDAGLGETKIGRYLGPSHQAVSLMSYWILPASGIPVSQTTIQRITYLETCTDAKKSRFKVFDGSIQKRFHENYNEATFYGESSSKPTMEMWDEISDNDEDLKE